MAASKESEILKIVDDLTSTGQKTLDEGKMKNLKKICKLSNSFVSYAYYAVMTQLRKNHAEIRYSALLIINELFCRSSCFRSLLNHDLSEFFELVVGTNNDKPLPEPLIRAKELKLKALKFIQEWSSKYGAIHRRLVSGLNYLKSCKKVDFNDMEARTDAQRERVRQEQEKQERILREKVHRIRFEMKEMTGEICNRLVHMENCFRLLVPHPTDELFSGQDFEMEDTNQPTSSLKDDTHFEDTLRQHGMHDMKKTITIEVKDNSEIAVKANEDTAPIIDNLNDLHKEMTNRFIPMVTKWLKILTKGNDCVDDLKKAIDLKQMIESAFQKYKDLKIMPDVHNSDDDEDDDFIEVPEIEGGEDEVKNAKLISSVSKPSCSKKPTAVEKAYMWNFKHSQDDVKDPTSAVSTLTKRIVNTKSNLSLPCTKELPSKQMDKKKSQKEELLNKAPILPYDIDLYHWEEEKPLIPEVVKFDSLHKFWESQTEADENETLKEDQMASLRTRKIDFSGKFEPVKWSCRAPLPSGKLCPRKDRYKCPLHGKIVKRDSLGNPVDPQDVAGPSSSQTAAVPDWQDPELLKDIEAATGMNLKLPPKKGQKKGNKLKSGLTNIKVVKTTPKERMTKKILKRYKHYAKKIDDADRKRFNDKFGDQWNYY